MVRIAGERRKCIVLISIRKRKETRPPVLFSGLPSSFIAFSFPYPPRPWASTFFISSLSFSILTLEQNNIHRMLVARQIGFDPTAVFDTLSSSSSGSSSATNVPNIVTVVTTTTLPGGGQSTVTISGSLSATTSSNTGSGNTVSGNGGGNGGSSSSNLPSSLAGTTTVSGNGGSNSGSSSSNLPSSLAGTTSGNSGANKSSPIGAIVGGVLGGLLFVIVIFFFLYYRRTKKKHHANEVEQVQPFHDNPSSGAGPSSTSQYEASGAYRSQQTPNSRGFFARKAATLAATSPQSPNANTIPNFPTAPLLQPNGKREEPLAESSQPVTSRSVVTHEDSGFRMPRAGRDRAALQSIIVEYPPAYTPG